MLGRIKSRDNGQFKYRINFILVSIVEAFIVFLAIGCFVYLLYSMKSNHDSVNSIQTDSLIVLDNWKITYSDGTSEELTMPFEIHAEKGETVTLEASLPLEFKKANCISLRNYKTEMDIYVNDRLRQRVYNDSYFPFRNNICSKDIYINLQRGDQGQVLKLVMSNQTSEKTIFGKVYVGEKASILKERINENRFELIIAIGMVVMSIVCIIIGAVIRFYTKNRERLDYMGWAMFFVAMWNITQSQFRDIIFQNIKAISLVPIFSLMMFVLSLVLFSNKLQRSRHMMAFNLFSCIMIGFFFIRLYLQLNSISDFYNALPFLFALIFVLIGLIIVTSEMDRRKGFRLSLWMVLGIFFLSLSGIIQAVGFMSGLIVSGVPLLMGVLILMIMTFVDTIKGISNSETERRAAVALADSKSQFVASMSHELRTPINAILGFNESILRETKDPVILDYAKDVNSAGNLLLSLVNDILDYSKIDAGKMKLNLTEYSLKDLINSTYLMVQNKNKEKNLDIKLDIDENLPNLLIGDDVRIGQIVLNLFTNAIKYTEKGFVICHTKFIPMENDEILLIISIQDTGIGIKEEDLSKLFDTFTRLDEMKNKNVEGTGLGLTISKQLLDIMGGTIDVESIYGEGSIFTVTIPQKVVKDSEKVGVLTQDVIKDKIKADEKSELAMAGKTGTILIVDDAPLNLKVAKSHLKTSALTIDTASSGLECLVLTNEKKYDIILLDHMMPELDGLETFKALRKDTENPNNETPVIMLTANAGVGMSDFYTDMGFADYISKPFNAKVINDMLYKYIGN